MGEFHQFNVSSSSDGGVLTEVSGGYQEDDHWVAKPGYGILLLVTCMPGYKVAPTKVYHPNSDTTSDITDTFQVDDIRTAIVFVMPDEDITLTISFELEDQSIMGEDKNQHVGWYSVNDGGSVSINGAPPQNGMIEFIEGQVISIDAVPDENHSVQRVDVITVAPGNNEYIPGEYIDMHRGDGIISIVPGDVKFNVTAPDSDILIIVVFAPKAEERVHIPAELAKELSHLLTKRSIRESMLDRIMYDPNKYETVEEMLIPVYDRISAIQYSITEKYIPEQYQSEDYQWDYNGWEIDGDIITIRRVNR